MLRSENMTYYNIYISKDGARDTVAELGKTELVHFVDLNEKKTATSALFSKEIRYLKKLELRLSAVLAEIEKRNVTLADLCDTMQNVDDVDVYLEKTYLRLQNLKEIEAETDEYLGRLKEDLFMLRECELFFGGDAEESKDCVVNLGYLVGIIAKEKAEIFDSVIFNSLKRNFVVHKSDLFLHAGQKTCYIMLTHGSEALAKALKIFSSLGGRIHCMEDERYQERARGVLKVTSLISQISKVSQNNRETMRRFLVSVSRQIRNCRFVISRELEIFRTLSRFRCSYERDGSETSIIGEAWVPERFRSRFERSVEHINESQGSVSYEEIPGTGTPPTFIVTNEYTDVFQSLNNIFEIPYYKEVNPGIFMLFTFPALFGIMFSDAFHGLLILGLGLFLVLYNGRLPRRLQALERLSGLRFLLVSLGISAVYFGLLFNDFGSVSIRLFRSKIAEGAEYYPFGVDWGWHKARNRADFYNNLKLKLSIIAGSIHVGFGIVVSYVNALVDLDRLRLYTDVVPRAAVFFTFNGYLVFLILYKWVRGTKRPLLEVLIDMYTHPFKSANLYQGQFYVQAFLLSVIIVSIMWLFLSRPIYRIFQKRKTGDGDWTNFLIEHLVHTMEFCIGLVSNTASYLRLWAVSLAHATLTEILHENTFGWSTAFGALTFPIVYMPVVLVLLCGMEGISAALHALRLNWIEFNSKFLRGKGVAFAPLVFREIRDEDT